MQYIIITPPVAEPISLAEAKSHLRVDFDEDDSYIQSLIIPAARQAAEQYTERVFMTQTLEVAKDSFYGSNCIELAAPPLQSVESIKYIDTDDIEQLLPASEYRVYLESNPPVIMENISTTWPATLAVKNAVKVRYVAGYVDANAVPAPIKAAILLMIGHLYENREENTSVNIHALPLGVDALLQPYKVGGF